MVMSDISASNSPLDTLCSFSKIKGTSAALSVSSGPVRYAIRQVLEHEYHKELLRQQAEHRQQRLGSGVSAFPSSLRSSLTAGMGSPSAGASTSRPKRDFFGRIIANPAPTGDSTEPKSKDGNASSDGKPLGGKADSKDTKAWVSFHEGFSNAVRKGITIKELLSGL
jgi:chromosome transmission fidelity protein 18